MSSTAIAGWLIALLVVLLVMVAIVLVAGLILGMRRRRRVRQSDWNTQALDACAAAASLHDHLETRLTLDRPADVDAVNATEPAGRWSDTERSIDQLSTKLHTLRFNAPDYTSDQATQQVIMTLAALRSALQVQHGARAIARDPAGEPAAIARARLMEFDAATRALRAAI